MGKVARLKAPRNEFEATNLSLEPQQPAYGPNILPTIPLSTLSLHAARTSSRRLTSLLLNPNLDNLPCILQTNRPFVHPVF